PGTAAAVDRSVFDELLVAFDAGTRGALERFESARIVGARVAGNVVLDARDGPRADSRQQLFGADVNDEAGRRSGWDRDPVGRRGQIGCTGPSRGCAKARQRELGAAPFVGG